MDRDYSIAVPLFFIGFILESSCIVLQGLMYGLPAQSEFHESAIRCSDISQREIADEKNFSITTLPVEIAAGDAL